MKNKKAISHSYGHLETVASPGRLQPEQPVGRAQRPRVERQRLCQLGVGAPRLRRLLAGLAVTAVMGWP